MPTLLQINETANSCSHGKIANEIGVLAMEHGWRSVIAYGRWANRSQNELLRIGTDFDVSEHGVEARLFDNQGLASRAATKKFIRQIEELCPDVIHLHNIHGYYLNYKLLFEYLNGTNIPVVWTLHDCWPITGHCSHFVTVNCEKWKRGCNDCDLKGKYPKSYIDRSNRNYVLKKQLFSSNNKLHLVTVSNWLAKIVEQSFLKNHFFRVIYNGVDIDLFKPINVVNNGKYRLLGVSNVWNEEKGLNDIFMLREILDDEYEIVLVGLTKRQVERLPKGIIGIEHTSSVQELVGYYSSSNILLNPTYADSFPSVNLEALACGTPVITYRTGGSPEAIDSDTGLVVNQGDVSGMASAIVRLCHLNQIELSNKCRARAENLFDCKKQFNDYLLLYEQLLK